MRKRRQVVAAARRLRYAMLLLTIVWPFAAARAQTATPTPNPIPSVAVRPAELKVQGIAGETLTRTVVLTTDGPVSALSATPIDLPNDAGSDVFPAHAIEVARLPATVAARQAVPFSVRFHLRNVPCGEFHGELLLLVAGMVRSLPVTVKVKDGWLWPLVTLLLGIVLSTIATAYRRHGRPRDEVLRTIGSLDTRLRRSVGALPATFAEYIRQCMLDVQLALEREELENARTAARRADDAWYAWERAKDRWAAQLDYLGGLQQAVRLLPPNARYVTLLDNALEDAARAAPQQTITALRDRLEQISRQIDAYAEAQRYIDALRQRVSALSPANRGDLETRLADLRRKLDDSKPEEATADLMRADLDAVASDVSARETTGGVGAGAERMIQAAPATRLKPPPPTAGGLPSLSAAAVVRLRAFQIAGYVIAIVLLAGAGFNELYWTRPTFGANRLADYFALLAWGFGAEATRSAIRDVVFSWGVPGLEKS